MLEHIFIVIILLQTSYLLNNTLQYNSSQDYFLQAPIWDGPFKKTPISFSLHNLKIIQREHLKDFSNLSMKSHILKHYLVWHKDVKMDEMVMRVS